MKDIEALKHDKVSAAVKCVGILRSMFMQKQIPQSLYSLVSDGIDEYMTAEDALTIALDDRHEAWEARMNAEIERNEIAEYREER